MCAGRTRSSGAIQDALGIKELRVIGTGGDEWQAEREQWDDGNNVVALEPGVVVAYERNEFTNALMRKAGIEVLDASTARSSARAAVAATA